MKHKIATLTIIILLSSVACSNSLYNLFLIEKDAINSNSYFLNIKKPYLVGRYSLGAINVDGSYNNQRSYSLYMNSFSPVNADSTTQTWFNYNAGSFDYMHTEVGALLKDKYNFHHEFSGKGTSFRGAYTEQPSQTLIESYYYNIGKEDSLETFNFSYMYSQENLNDYYFNGGSFCNDNPQSCLMELEPYESASYFLATKYFKKGKLFNLKSEYQFKTGSYNFFGSKSKVKQYSLNVVIEKDFFNYSIFLEFDKSKYKNSLFESEISTVNFSKISLKRNLPKLFSVIDIVSLSDESRQLHSDIELLVRYKFSDYSFIAFERSIDIQNLFNNALWINHSLSLSLHTPSSYLGDVDFSGSFFSAKSKFHKNMLNNNFEGTVYNGLILSYAHKYKYLNCYFGTGFYQNNHKASNNLIVHQESSFNIKNFKHFELELSPSIKAWKISPFTKVNYRSVGYGQNNQWDFFDYRLLDLSFGFKTSGFMFEYVIHNYNPNNEGISDILGHDELIGVNISGNPSATFPLYQVNYFKVVWHFVD